MNRLIFLLLLTLLSSCTKKEEKIEIIRKDDTLHVAGDQKQQGNSTPQNDKPAEEQTSNLKNNTNSGVSAIIKPAESKQHINQRVTVKGFVADVTLREKVAYLNFDKKYPKNTLSAVVFKDKFDAFGDLAKYKGRTVSVTGIITLFNDKPQIIMNSPGQINFTD